MKVVFSFGFALKKKKIIIIAFQKLFNAAFASGVLTRAIVESQGQQAKCHHMSCSFFPRNGPLPKMRLATAQSCVDLDWGRRQLFLNA